jgi:cyclophilin family peptidyl-prolyl cis-trans isomerase
LAVIQAGGFTADGSLSSIPTFAPITNEYSLSNSPGTVAMAKLGGNPNSATSQWFVNVSDNSSTLNSNNNGGFTVFAKVRGNGMSNVINRISLLQTYNISGYNAAFTETPLQGLTSSQQSLYLSNLVTFTRVATLPYFAFSSDSDACPADINSSTNLVVTFKHYPTNNPVNGVYITVAVTDTNGISPTYTNYTTSNGAITATKSSSVVFTNIYYGGNTGFFVVPTTPGNQTITFPQIPQQALSNNITNITTNYVASGSNIVVGSITTNIYTSFRLSSFPTSSANVPVLLQILSGPIKVTGTNQTTGIPNGTEFTLTGTGTVTLKATTFGTGISALVNNYYNPASAVTNSFVVTATPQSIAPFQTIFSPIYGTPPLQINIPNSSSGLPVTVSVLSGPASFKAINSNTGTLTITGGGAVTLAANQSGNAQYAPAPQVTTTFTVSRAVQSISFPKNTTNLAVGQTISLAATSSATLPVLFSVKSGPATLTGSSLKITGPGTVSIAANQSGNSNYFPAPEIVNSYRTASNQTISAFGSITNRPYTTNPLSITLPAATSALPVTLSVKSGPATLLSSNTISLKGTGTVTLAADQAGNSNNFAAPQVTTSFVVSKAVQTIAPLTGIPAKLSNGISFTVPPPSSSSGLTNTSLLVTGSGKLSSSNIITLTNAGTLTITATNAGNSNYLAASLTTNITVAAGSQSISFPAFSLPLVVGTTNSLSATASSGLPVSYSLSPTYTNVVLVSNSIVVKSYSTNTFKVVASQTNTNTGWIVATPVTNSFSVTTNGPSSSTGGTLTLGGGSSGVTIVNGGSGSLTTGGISNSYSGGSTISNGALNLNSNSGNLTLSNSSSSNASSSNTISLGTGTLSISNTNNSGSTTNTNSLGGSISLATNVVIITFPTPTPTP